MTAKSRINFPGMCRPEMNDVIPVNPRDYHRSRDTVRSAKKSNFIANFKDWLEGKSAADAHQTGAQWPSNGPSHQSGGGTHILIPRVLNQEDPRFQPASSSHGDRNGSRDDVYHLRAPPPGSYQDDDTGPSPKNLVMAVMGVKSAVNHFAKALISDMKKFPAELEHLKQTIHREVEADVDRANHWKFLVQAFVCKQLFEGFDTENGFFGIEDFNEWNMTSIISFVDFSKFKDKAATISYLLAKDSADGSFLEKFCFKKFKSISGDLSTNHPLPIYHEDWSTVARERHPKSDFYQSFLKVAVSVWLLHRLVHSFEQGWSMLGWETYPKGSRFQRKNMESVVPGGYEEDDEDTDVNTEVGFLVIPGFQVSKSVVKCEVYLRNKNRHKDGKITEAVPQRTSSDKSPLTFQTPERALSDKSPPTFQTPERALSDKSPASLRTPEKHSRNKSPASLRTPEKHSRNKSPVTYQTGGSFNSLSNYSGGGSAENEAADYWATHHQTQGNTNGHKVRNGRDRSPNSNSGRSDSMHRAESTYYLAPAATVSSKTRPPGYATRGTKISEMRRQMNTAGKQTSGS